MEKLSFVSLEENADNMPSGIRKLFKRLQDLFKRIFPSAKHNKLNDNISRAYEGFYTSGKNNANIDTTGAANDSTTAIREGYSDGRGDDLGSDIRKQVSTGDMRNGIGNAEGIPGEVRLSERQDFRRDIGHNRALLLGRILKDIDPNSHAVEFKQLNNTGKSVARKFKEAIDKAQC